jgi:acyl-CoA thioesterase-1
MIDICAFGNSLTAGFGVPAEACLPRQLSDQLHTEGFSVTISNHGISGDTTSGGLRRIQTALGHRPDMVILELGINDILMGISSQRIKANLEHMILACRQARATILLAGFTAVPGIPAPEADEFNSLYPDLAQAYDLSLFPDFLDHVVGNPDFTLPDGLHPNARGITFIVNRLAPVVIDLLKSISARDSI